MTAPRYLPWKPPGSSHQNVLHQSDQNRDRENQPETRRREIESVAKLPARATNGLANHDPAVSSQLLLIWMMSF